MSAMDRLGPDTAAASARPQSARTLIALAPALAAIAYPFLLKGFHAALAPAGGLFAPILLAVAFAAPLLGLALALRSAGLEHPSRFQLRACYLALVSVAAPPLYVFQAFVLTILGKPVPEDWSWTILWAAVAAWVWAAPGAEEEARAPAPPAAKLRMAHGVVAAIALIYIAFHLTNHLFGLIGPEAHGAVMKLGRTVYRGPVVQPLLVALLLFQVVSGGWMALQWSARTIDRYRIFQVASGVYLWFFILTHLNSAFISARAMHGIDTNWAWATGAPTGLIHDAWNIRLVPHYALGVFCILAHLASGLRGVLIAHGAAPTVANRAWAVGLVGAALVSAAIIGALVGLRI